MHEQIRDEHRQLTLSKSAAWYAGLILSAALFQSIDLQAMTACIQSVLRPNAGTLSPPVSSLKHSLKQYEDASAFSRVSASELATPAMSLPAPCCCLSVHVYCPAATLGARMLS